MTPPVSHQLPVSFARNTFTFILLITIVRDKETSDPISKWSFYIMGECPDISMNILLNSAEEGLGRGVPTAYGSGNTDAEGTDDKQHLGFRGRGFHMPGVDRSGSSHELSMRGTTFWVYKVSALFIFCIVTCL